MTRSATAVVVAIVVAGSARAGDPPRRPYSADEARMAIERGVAFLLQDQNSEGSWGGPRGAIYTFTGDVWSNPETHHCWQFATTALCCMALLEAGHSDEAAAAADRAVDYLIENAAVKRPCAWDTMNSWAYIYGAQALARAYTDPRYAGSQRREHCRAVGEELLRQLAACQSPQGGWGYLEFNVPRTPRQQWSTSFTTSAAVVAMVDARQAGFAFDDAMLQRAARAIRHCRLPSGAYTYSIPVIPDPRNMEWIDQIKGSLGRTQSCNLALLMAGQGLPQEWLTTGLANLFRFHRFLDIARNKPIPHETFYYNSGYFYLFGHYYAARLIQRLPPEQREEYWPRLRYEVGKLQQEDGSMYDYDMHAYHKPYGTAFGVLALVETVRDAEETPPEQSKAVP